MKSRTLAREIFKVFAKGKFSVPKGLSFIARTEILGGILVLISIFTLLGLLTGPSGSITGLWIDLLQATTGDGVAAVPLLSGLLGLWLILRAIDKPQPYKRALPWQKPTGLLLIFLAYITSLTLWLPSMTRAAVALNAEAGGTLGLFFADLLEAGLHVRGAWIAITFSVVLALMLLMDRLLLKLALDSWDVLRNMARDHQLLENLAQKILALYLNFSVKISRAKPGASERPLQDSAEMNRPPPVTDHSPHTLQKWRLPHLDDMLGSWDRSVDSDDLIRQRGQLLEETLALFGVPAAFEGVNAGPTVTQYLIRPGYVERTVRGETKRTKVKVSKIASLTNDLALALAAQSVRIEAPIPGTNYVGIEVPNTAGNNVGLKELMKSEAFEKIQPSAQLPIALGEDVKGQAVVTDLARMPHLLIAGATGTGKSVCINSIIGCLLLTHTPDTLGMLMIDPKMVELTIYNDTPHLISPVVTDVDRAAGVLYWCVKEMERRYQLLNKAGARDLERYNAYAKERNEEILPLIVVIVDEMADLMMTAPEEVEKYLIRLAQMARAVGMHLVIATQRPSVDVLTGLIKANFPARIAFAVTSQTDSRVVLDVPGAERLLGRGDMLFMAADASKLERLQGAVLEEGEINRIIQYWQGLHNGVSATPVASNGVETPLQVPTTDHRSQATAEQIQQMKTRDARDDLFDEAVQVVTEAGRGSVTILQRQLRIGYNRASRLVEQLETSGILGPDRGGNQGREVYTNAPAVDQAQLASPIHGDDDTPPRIWM